MNERLASQLRPYFINTLKSSLYLTEEDVRRFIQQERCVGLSRGDKWKDALRPHSGVRSAIDYQQEVIRGFREIVENGHRRVLISLPTGAGKTYTMVSALLSILGSGKRCIWLAPQALLVEQAHSEFARCWWEDARNYRLHLSGLRSQKQIDVAKGSLGDACVFLCTVQKLLRIKPIGAHFDYVIFDEAHHLEENDFYRSVEQLVGDSTTLVGLTATPGRTVSRESERLAEIFDRRLLVPEALGKSPILQLKSRGVFADLDWHKLALRVDREADITERRQGEVASYLAALSARRLDAIIELFRMGGIGRKTMVFCYSHAHAVIVAAALNRATTKVCAVVGSAYSAGHNSTVLEAFREGDIDVLVNVKYLATGADIPAADSAVLTIPIGSPVLFEQIVGRVSRGPRVGGTPSASIAEFDDHRKIHGGLKSYERFADLWR